MKAKILKLNPNAIIPQYQTAHAAAMDIHACIDESITVAPRERVVVPTGFAVELPSGYEAQIRARSGLALKHGITIANGVGTIDADYRGEYGAIVVNLSDDPYVIEPGARIAQMVIAPVDRVEWDEVASLGESARAGGGYGSTGY